MAQSKAARPTEKFTNEDLLEAAVRMASWNIPADSGGYVTAPFPWVRAQAMATVAQAQAMDRIATALERIAERMT